MNTNGHDLPQTLLDKLLLDTSPYLSCDECFERLDRYAERVVADPQHADLPMQVHLNACGACAEEAETLIDLLSGRA
ncbi:MAG: hypothetical protein V9G13_02405 [Marmoricola sp.]|jgi:hypothetical protein